MQKPIVIDIYHKKCHLWQSDFNFDSQQQLAKYTAKLPPKISIIVQSVDFEKLNLSLFTKQEIIVINNIPSGIRGVLTALTLKDACNLARQKFFVAGNIDFLNQVQNLQNQND